MDASWTCPSGRCGRERASSSSGGAATSGAGGPASPAGGGEWLGAGEAIILEKETRLVTARGVKRRVHEPAPSLDPGDLPVAVTRGETERAGLEALAGRACLAALSGGRLRLGRGALFGASHARLDGKLAASRGRAPPSLSPSPSPPRAPRRRRRPRRRAAQHARRRGLPGWWRSGGAWPGRQPRLLLPRRLEGTRRCSRVLAARLRLVDRRLALFRLVGLGGRALGRAGRRADHGSRLARAGAARARPAVRARNAAVERRREAAHPSPNPQAAPCARVRHRAREAADAEGRRAREACGRVSGTCQRDMSAGRVSGTCSGHE